MENRNKRILITGASSGTGAEATRILHKQQYNILPIGHSETKMKLVAEPLGLTYQLIDFSDLNNIIEVANRINEPAIDVLALNAGGIFGSKDFTKNGLETNLQVNAIGPLLFLLLLHRKSRIKTVILTTSDTHRYETANQLDLAHLKPLSSHRSYARSKLIISILLREFGRRRPQVKVVDFHPGIIVSDLGRHWGITGRILKFLTKPFLDAPIKGGERLAALISKDDLVTNGYYFKTKLGQGSNELENVLLAKQLWQAFEHLLTTKSIHI